jgi:hypothetical protein
VGRNGHGMIIRIPAVAGVINPLQSWL